MATPAPPTPPAEKPVNGSVLGVVGAAVVVGATAMTVVVVVIVAFVVVVVAFVVVVVVAFVVVVVAFVVVVVALVVVVVVGTGLQSFSQITRPLAVQLRPLWTPSIGGMISPHSIFWAFMPGSKTGPTCSR